MQRFAIRWVWGVSFVAVCGLLAACQLPKSGPNKNEILAGSTANGGNAFVVEVDDRVAKATSAIPQFGFSSTFTSAQSLTADTVRPGDVLGLSIWENVDDGLLTSDLGGATILDQVQVDSDGYIFVPYAGRADQTASGLAGISHPIYAQDDPE